MSLTIPNDYTPQDISHLRYCIWDIGGPLYSRGNPGLSEVVNEQFYRVIVHRTGWKRSVAKREYDKLYDETNRARESLIQLTGEDCLEECMDAVDPRPYLARDTELVQLIEDLKQYYGIKPIILTNGITGERTIDELKIWLINDPKPRIQGHAITVAEGGNVRINPLSLHIKWRSKFVSLCGQLCSDIGAWSV